MLLNLDEDRIFYAFLMFLIFAFSIIGCGGTSFEFMQEMGLASALGIKICLNFLSNRKANEDDN